MEKKVIHFPSEVSRTQVGGRVGDPAVAMVFVEDVPVRADFKPVEFRIVRPGVVRRPDPAHVQIGDPRGEGKTGVPIPESDKTIVGSIADVAADGVCWAGEPIGISAAEEVFDRRPPPMISP